MKLLATPFDPETLTRWKLIEAVTTDHAHIGNTLVTTVKQITIPANSMGANGILKINVLFHSTGTSGTFYYYVYFGTLGAPFIVDFKGVASSNKGYQSVPIYIWNKNSTSNQGRRNYPYDSHNPAGVERNSTFDTTNNLYVILKVKNPNATSTSTLRFASVEVLQQN